MLDRLVRKYIEQHRLLPERARIIVALSGGADSVALLDIMARSDYACIAAHANFHLRGEESDRDAAFAHQMCRELGIPFYKKDLYAADYAEREGLSIEMAAREMRYHWFEQLRQEQQAVAIAVAHHRDDSVETVLLNLIRGTGIRGLTGIKPKNGFVVRPLLCADRETVLEYIEQRHLTYVTDRSNLLNEYRRNKIRLDVLPLLESIQPSVRTSIARSMQHLSDVETLYEQAIASAKERICLPLEGKEVLRISVQALDAEVAAPSVLYEILSGYGFGRSDVQSIFKNRHGLSGRVYHSLGHRLIFDRAVMLVSPMQDVDAQSFWISDQELAIQKPITLTFSRVNASDQTTLVLDKHIASLDADKLQFPLELRHPKKGDSIIPYGMRGRKLISDFCTDCKMSVLEKENLWLLCSGKDVVWIVGERIDHRYRIEDATQHIYRIEWKDGE